MHSELLRKLLVEGVTLLHEIVTTELICNLEDHVTPTLIVLIETRTLCCSERRRFLLKAALIISLRRACVVIKDEFVVC